MVIRSILPDAVFDSRLCLFLPETRTLVVADLHWGYAESHRAAGNLFPVWGDAELEAKLHALIADHRPNEIVWLGDSLHSARSAPLARARAEAFIGASLVPVIVVAGNHDARWPLARIGPLRRGRFVLHHGDRALGSSPSERLTEAECEIVGHHHPAYLHCDGAGTRLKVPALVQTPRCLILPAFSPWAAGVAWNQRLHAGDVLWAATPRRLLRFPAVL